MTFQGRDEITFSDGSTAQKVAVVDSSGNHPTVKRAKIDAAASGDNEVLAAVTGKKICVLGLILVAKEAVDVTVYSDVQAGGTALTGVISLADNEGFVLPPPTNAGMHWFETASAKKLNIYLSAAKQVSGCLLYSEA